MIPHTIHYCWFGRKPLPKSARKCIASWRKYLPNYEIKEWNEDTFDVNIIPYTAEAYKEKQYAFVSDYARFWILFHYGGLYFDTDVEIIRPIDDIIAHGSFMGCENESKFGNNADCIGVNPGLGIGVQAGLSLLNEILATYNDLHFINNDGSLNKKTIVEYTTEALLNYGLKNTSEVQECGGIYIYPND